MRQEVTEAAHGLECKTCFGKYAVPGAELVLVYLAEDVLLVVCKYIQGMARHCGLNPANIAIRMITVPVLRLARGSDQHHFSRRGVGFRHRREVARLPDLTAISELLHGSRPGHTAPRPVR